LFFCIHFTPSNPSFCLFQRYCLIAQAFLLGSSGTVGEFSSPSHSICTTRERRQISCFSKIICATQQLYSLRVGTTEEMHQSTLLTEMPQLMTDCQAHQSVLSAFAKRLNTKPNTLNVALSAAFKTYSIINSIYICG